MFAPLPTWGPIVRFPGALPPEGGGSPPSKQQKGGSSRQFLDDQIRTSSQVPARLGSREAPPQGHPPSIVWDPPPDLGAKIEGGSAKFRGGKPDSMGEL
jgi:hypothetical protein